MTKALEAIKARSELAYNKIFSLCKGEKWKMCVPVRQDDSDIVLTTSLNDIAKLIAVIECQDRALDKCGVAAKLDSKVNEPTVDKYIIRDLIREARAEAAKIMEGK